MQNPIQVSSLRAACAMSASASPTPPAPPTIRTTVEALVDRLIATREGLESIKGRLFGFEPCETGSMQKTPESVEELLELALGLAHQTAAAAGSVRDRIS